MLPAWFAMSSVLYRQSNSCFYKYNTGGPPEIWNILFWALTAPLGSTIAGVQWYQLCALASVSVLVLWQLCCYYLSMYAAAFGTQPLWDYSGYKVSAVQNDSNCSVVSLQVQSESTYSEHTWYMFIGTLVKYICCLYWQLRGVLTCRTSNFAWTFTIVNIIYCDVIYYSLASTNNYKNWYQNNSIPVSIVVN